MNGATMAGSHAADGGIVKFKPLDRGKPCGLPYGASAVIFAHSLSLDKDALPRRQGV